MFIRSCYPAFLYLRPFLHKSSHKRGDGKRFNSSGAQRGCRCYSPVDSPDHH